MNSIENVRGESRHDGFARETDGFEPVQEELPTHHLDSEESMRVHARLLDWFFSARDAHLDNLIEQQLDYDFYDHIQWSEEDRQVLAARHQAPLTYNKIKLALDWIVGTERRTRIDGKVHPRSEDDVEIAAVKGELLKYLSDTNRVPFERSDAFKDSVISGIGWTNETVRNDRADEPIEISRVHWRQMLWDQFSRKADLSDARFVMRRKHVDLEYGEAMFPGRTGILGRAARDHLSVEDNYEMAVDLPQVWRRYDSRGYEMSSRSLVGRVSMHASVRMRVSIIECWFRRPRPVQKIWGPGYRGVMFDQTNPDHVKIKDGLGQQQNVYSIGDAVNEEIWCAIFTEEGLLQLCKSPFQHGQFPFTPYWCYRRDRDGMPYGIVRGIRDAQEDMNKRFSKLLWALSTNQLFYEDGAMEEEDVERNKEEIAKPNGVVKLKNGGLNKIKIERNLDVAEAQIKLIELDAAHIHDGSGVNRELLGRDTNASSGRAILAKQQEGAVSTAEPFDRYRLGIQLSGEKLLSLAEQYMSERKQFRLVGERKGVDWATVNDPYFDEASGEWAFKNDITASHADFIVDQQDFRESMRQAYAEQLLDMLGKLPPDVSVQLLDLAFEMTDMPGKDEIVKRMRAINGQGDPEAQDSPEQLAKRETEQQEAELAMRERLSKVGLNEAKANEISARIKTIGLGNKKTALDVAQLLDILLPLAPAADRLLSDTQPATAATPQQEPVYAQ